jgi:hypothetical protein
MKKVILDVEDGTIDLSSIYERHPIFAKRDGKLIGMMVKDDEGWMVKLGGTSGATGHHETRRKCIESCLRHDYEFFTE